MSVSIAKYYKDPRMDLYDSDNHVFAFTCRQCGLPIRNVREGVVIWSRDGQPEVVHSNGTHAPLRGDHNELQSPHGMHECEVAYHEGGFTKHCCDLQCPLVDLLRECNEATSSDNTFLTDKEVDAWKTTSEGIAHDEEAKWLMRYGTSGWLGTIEGKAYSEYLYQHKTELLVGARPLSAQHLLILKHLASLAKMGADALYKQAKGLVEGTWGLDSSVSLIAHLCNKHTGDREYGTWLESKDVYLMWLSSVEGRAHREIFLRSYANPEASAEKAEWLRNYRRSAEHLRSRPEQEHLRLWKQESDWLLTAEGESYWNECGRPRHDAFCEELLTPRGAALKQAFRAQASQSLPRPEYKSCGESKEVDELCRTILDQAFLDANNIDEDLFISSVEHWHLMRASENISAWREAFNKWPPAYAHTCQRFLTIAQASADKVAQ